MPTTTTEQPLTCTVKPPKLLTFGDTTFHSGITITEIVFSSTNPPRETGKIELVNNYAASITLKVKMRREGKEGRKEIWKTALKDYKLMPNPHCETGGQSYFTIWPDDLLFLPTYVLMFRFIVRQPSPSWRDFSLEEIYVYSAGGDKTNSPATLPKWITEKPGKKPSSHKATAASHKVDLDMNEISKLTQQMMMMTSKAADSTPNVKVGRFDVDGCYEINLLTYS